MADSRRHMKPKQIEAFKVVMESGSMTAAAEKLFVTQPAVTKLIAQLEYETKLSLFERVKGRLIPTADGKIFYQHVLRTYEALDDLGRIAEDIKTLDRGRLNIGTLPLLSTSWLPYQCARFGANKSQINISLISNSSTRIQEWIVAGQLDVGISMIADDPRARAEVLAAPEAVCILPPDHSLCKKDSISASDLNGQDFILTGGVDGTREKIEGLFKALDVRVRVKYETIFSSATCAFVAAGAGVALVNAFSAAEFSHLPYVIRPFRPKLSFHIYLLTARSRTLPKLANAFIEFLSTRAKAEIERPSAPNRPKKPKTS